jgi:FkbM family methyltransferase
LGKEFRSIEHEVIYNKLINGSDRKEHILDIQNSSSPDTHKYLSEIHGFINNMLQTRENYAYRHLQSHRNTIGPLIVFSKKVVRKLLKWYVEPIAFQQTKFNNAVTPAIGRITELTAELIDKTNKIEELYQANLTELEHKQKRFDEIVAQLTQKQEKQEILLLDSERINKELTEKVGLLEKRQNVQQEQFSSYIIDRFREVSLLENGNKTIFDKKTYSQSGEDSIVAYIIHVLGIPFDSVDYLDLGANHAKELSNTYYLYSKGAKGVLVEANTDLIPELSYYRQRDTILNKCVDIESGKKIEFFVLNGDGLSTTDLEAANSFCETNPSLKIIDKRIVETISYSNIVEEYLGKAPTVLSIDIEGKDMEILLSIDFENQRPLIIISEMVSYDIKLSHTSKKSDIKDFLESKDYDEYAFTGINSIFLDKRYVNERNK